jgi:hypothetical protein
MYFDHHLILQVWHELCEYDSAVNDYTAALHNQPLSDDDSVTLYRYIC